MIYEKVFVLSQAFHPESGQPIGNAREELHRILVGGAE